MWNRTREAQARTTPRVVARSMRTRELIHPVSEHGAAVVCQIPGVFLQILGAVKGVISVNAKIPRDRKSDHVGNDLPILDIITV
jgi:hypothetical protein